MKKTRKGQISNIIFTMIVTAFVTIIVTCLVLYSNGYINKSATKSNSSYNKLNSKLDLINSLAKRIDEEKMSVHELEDLTKQEEVVKKNTITKKAKTNEYK